MCGILALVISIWQYRWSIRYLWGEPFAPIAGVTNEGMQSPVMAVAILLIFVGLFAFFCGLVQRGQIIGGGTKQITGVQPVGGFLPDPSLLNPGGAGQPDLVYRSPTANFASYNKVILEPVAIWAAPDSQLNTVPVEQRQAAANAFYSDLYNALSRR